MPENFYLMWYFIYCIKRLYTTPTMLAMAAGQFSRCESILIIMIIMIMIIMAMIIMIMIIKIMIIIIMKIIVIKVFTMTMVRNVK